MGKILYFFYKSNFIILSIGILSIILYACNQEMIAIWFGHICFAIDFTIGAYVFTAILNQNFCDSIESKYESNSGFRKKVELNSFFKKIFCGYDDNGDILWWILIYQCIILLYICVFILLNIVFAITLITANANSEIWIRVWIIEMLSIVVLYNIPKISFIIKDLYLRLRYKERYKNDSSFRQMLKNDKKMINSKKIIKQKNEVFAFLKRYDIRFNKHKHYVISSTNAKQIEQALEKEFPKLRISSLENEKGIHIIEIHSAKKELLIQVEISN